MLSTLRVGCGRGANGRCAQNFLPQVVPIRKTNVSKRLVSADVHSNTANFKFSYLMEVLRTVLGAEEPDDRCVRRQIAPICRDDLVVFPPKISGQFGGAGPLMVCVKVSSQLHFIDPTNLNYVEIPCASALGARVTARAD